MLEAAVVIGPAGQPVFWHLPFGRTTGSIPDSRTLWEVLWDGRQTILGVAHSHPGGGVPTPSGTDLTTFAAVEAGLGVRLSWWITSSTRLVVCYWEGPGQLDYRVQVVNEEPPWADQLREQSKGATLVE